VVTTIIWMLLAILGIITGIWYFKSTIFNPYGRANYPALLWVWGPVGHLISWVLIILSIIAVVMLIKLLAIKTIFLILGVVLLAFSMWGWIGFVMIVRMRRLFYVATPSAFLSMGIIGLGLVITRYLPLLGVLLVPVGIVAGFVLYRILWFITKKRYQKRYLSIPEEMEEYIKEKRYYIYGEEKKGGVKNEKEK